MIALPSLPLYQTTRVRVAAINNTMRFYFNDTLVKNGTTFGTRISGEGSLSISQALLHPALAHLADVKMRQVSSFEEILVMDIPRLGQKKKCHSTVLKSWMISYWDAFERHLWFIQKLNWFWLIYPTSFSHHSNLWPNFSLRHPNNRTLLNMEKGDSEEVKLRGDSEEVKLNKIYSILSSKKSGKKWIWNIAERQTLQRDTWSFL